MRRLDEVYYHLLDMLRTQTGSHEQQGYQVAIPRLALNAIIMAAGRMGQLDRAYATFQEYTALFGLTADTAAFNALLYATARLVSAHSHPLTNTLINSLTHHSTHPLTPHSTLPHRHSTPCCAIPSHQIQATFRVSHGLRSTKHGGRRTPSGRGLVRPLARGDDGRRECRKLYGHIASH